MPALARSETVTIPILAALTRARVSQILFPEERLTRLQRSARERIGEQHRPEMEGEDVQRVGRRAGEVERGHADARDGDGEEPAWIRKAPPYVTAQRAEHDHRDRR